MLSCSPPSIIEAIARPVFYSIMMVKKANKNVPIRKSFNYTLLFGSFAPALVKFLCVYFGLVANVSVICLFSLSIVIGHILTLCWSLNNRTDIDLGGFQRKSLIAFLCFVSIFISNVTGDWLFRIFSCLLEIFLVVIFTDGNFGAVVSMVTEDKYADDFLAEVYANITKAVRYQERGLMPLLTSVHEIVNDWNDISRYEADYKIFMDEYGSCEDAEISAMKSSYEEYLTTIANVGADIFRINNNISDFDVQFNDSILSLHQIISAVGVPDYSLEQEQERFSECKLTLGSLYCRLDEINEAVANLNIRIFGYKTCINALKNLADQYKEERLNHSEHNYV